MIYEVTGKPIIQRKSIKSVGTTTKKPGGRRTLKKKWHPKYIYPKSDVR